MDLSYLAKAGPRQSEAQLLDHYHSHTERCHACRPALANVQRLQAVSGALAAAGAALAAMALLVQWGTAGVLLPAAAGKAAQQAAAAGSGALPPLVAFAAGCAAAAVLAALVWRWCCKTVPRFFSGVRPFARNRVKGEFAP